MDFPATPVNRITPPDGLARALGVPYDETYSADEDLMVVLPDEATVRGAAPDLAALSAIECRGIILTARGVEEDFVSRFFAPRCGMKIRACRPADWPAILPLHRAELAEVGRANLPALALYRSEGFVAAGEVGDKIRLRWTECGVGEEAE